MAQFCIVLTSRNIFSSSRTNRRSAINCDVGLEEKEETDEDTTVQEVVDSMTDEQRDVLHFLIGQAAAEATSAIEQSNMKDSTNTGDSQNQEGTTKVTKTHNAFEQGS